MGHARRWASVALVGLVAACLSGAVPGPARADEEVLDWKVSGGVEAGGDFPWGNRSSSMWNKYRDMTSTFLGELDLKAEKKDSPWYFEIGVKNPGLDDQMYDGAVGRYGLFRLEGGWNETPHVYSNTARTIFSISGDTLTLPPALRTPAALTTLNPFSQVAPAANNFQPTNTTNPTYNTTVTNNRFAIQNLINANLNPVSLHMNTDVGGAALKLTPTEALRFDLEWVNISRDGYRPLGTVIGGPGGSITELAIPIKNQTNEFKFGAEYAKPDWAVQFNYTGSWFNNNYNGYTWDNPLTSSNTVGQQPGFGGCPGPPGNTSACAGLTGSDRISAAPDNFAQTFNLTGTVALPLRTRINANFSYTWLQQNQTFDYNTMNPALGRVNTDDAGNSRPDAKANIYSGNIVLNSRPVNDVNVTAYYRYFEYQNDTPDHTFTNDIYQTGQGPTLSTGAPDKEGYRKQNLGLDLGWRPFQMLSLKGGFGYQKYQYSEFEGQNFSTGEYMIKAAADVTPTDWFLGRVTYLYGDRSLSGYAYDPAASLPQSQKYNYAPRTRNMVNVLFQFTPGETISPSISGSYANDQYYQNQYGLLNDDYWNVGFNLDWNPVKWLTIGMDASYEQYNYKMQNAYTGSTSPVVVGANMWNSKDKDEFWNFGVNGTVNIIPKKFIVTLGYSASLGYTTITTGNPNLVTPLTASSNPPFTNTNVNAAPYYWDKVFNVLQTFRIVAKYFLTDKLSVRLGYAYELYREKDFARDPMQPFMGLYEQAVTNGPPVPAGIQSVYLGATVPGYSASVLSGFVRYDF